MSLDLIVDKEQSKVNRLRVEFYGAISSRELSLFAKEPKNKKWQNVLNKKVESRFVTQRSLNNELKKNVVGSP